ncbi:bis(5'-nucleosyl)-tetraphosphatase (symmetrical) YqeK [Spirochaeta isovalerica]|uniref:bis(5'-nucleosyl)-tetraphosphatase (symmetrical) n=1 Tax=Spirochaeta isovalerica TaxID=150 RepID=A0A841R7T2_9SPIO|nr:bis(5'-nucleosyl)-tetraphosphatase (symmetrical) YqeK [Spirochaeta isovalerica]MBB6479029.1 nicotinate-nucleotide adenylyltransferase [Spirochaeta isovalerica]
MDRSLEKIRHHLKETLSGSRFRHSEGAEKASRFLAERFGEDPLLCSLAGLGHDICREYEADVLERITGRKHRHPVMLHGEAGAIVLERDFGIRNSSVLQAVRHHISGSPGLDGVGKIVFAADYIEEGRTHLSGEERERLFSLDLDDMVLSIACSIRSHLAAKRLPLEPALLQMIEELT